MSIKTIGRVLDHCKIATSSLRLTLVVLAEYADDDGYSWPSVPSIAQRTMLSPRHQTRVLTSIEEAGELYIDVGSGRGNTNGYLILSGRSESEIVELLIRKCRLLPPEAAAIAAASVSKRVGNPDTDVTLSKEKHGTDVRVSDPLKADTPVQKDDTPTQRVTPRRIKADTGVRGTVIEPSLRTVSEPSVEEEGATPAPVHPAIKIYQDILRRTPDAAECAYLEQALPDLDTQRWQDVCRLWRDRGWQSHMLSGLVDRYRRNAPARASPTLPPVAPAPPPETGTITLEAIDF